MTDFDFVTTVFLIPGAVGALVIQNIALRSDAAMALSKATRPIFNLDMRIVKYDDEPWWKFWRNW